MRSADVVVVGAGVMGSATARALARRGRDVVLLERFRVGHARGSSHGASRIFRLSYDDPEYVRLAMRALPLWRELEEESGEELLTTTGGLDIGPNSERHAAALQASDARFEWLDRAAVHERYPALRLDDGERALFQPDAGISHAERAWHAFARGAVAAGAELLEETRVVSVDARGDRVEVRTDEETFVARAAVITAGPWTRTLLAPVGIALPVRETRETVAYCRLEGGTLPSLVDWNGPPYFFSLADPAHGLKIGWHFAGHDADPEVEEPPRADIVDAIGRWVEQRFPQAETPPATAETCFYTRTEDESHILRREGPLVIGSACSGHGFKFAPATGERLADLADEGR